MPCTLLTQHNLPLVTAPHLKMISSKYKMDDFIYIFFNLKVNYPSQFYT